jgi:hypothetical protein
VAAADSGVCVESQQAKRLKKQDQSIEKTKKKRKKEKKRKEKASRRKLERMGGSSSSCLPPATLPVPAEESQRGRRQQERSARPAAAAAGRDGDTLAHAVAAVPSVAGEVGQGAAAVSSAGTAFVPLPARGLETWSWGAVLRRWGVSSAAAGHIDDDEDGAGGTAAACGGTAAAAAAAAGEGLVRVDEQLLALVRASLRMPPLPPSGSSEKACTR